MRVRCYGAAMENVLLTATDAEKYRGMYVTLSSLEAREVISGGRDPGDVLAEAARKGFDMPLLVFIPDSDAVWIY